MDSSCNKKLLCKTEAHMQLNLDDPISDLSLDQLSSLAEMRGGFCGDKEGP